MGKSVSFITMGMNLDGDNFPKFYELDENSKMEVEFFDGSKKTMNVNEFRVLSSIVNLTTNPNQRIFKVKIMG